MSDGSFKCVALAKSSPVLKKQAYLGIFYFAPLSGISYKFTELDGKTEII